jgi:DNA topoisomerase-2
MAGIPPEWGRYRIKYCKGLGTSTAAEAKEYFSHLKAQLIEFRWDGQADDMVEMAYAKNKWKIVSSGH